MTLLVRDEADIVDAQIAFHLNAGVDFVVATDHRSQDGTTDILQRYEGLGRLHLIRESGEDVRQSQWVTRMARLAATDFGADWVINTDADEFWWPREGSLKAVLQSVPSRIGVVRGCWRHFVPRPDDGAFFAERMTVRLSRPAHPGDKVSIFHAHQKVAHRGIPDVVVEKGNHDIVGSELLPLRTWHPIEVLHFSYRNLRQLELKGSARWPEDEPGEDAGLHKKLLNDAWRRGSLDEHLSSYTVDNAAVAAGIASGRLRSDVRLRDALRQLREKNGGFFVPEHGREARLRFPRPRVTDDAELADEIAPLEEIDGIVRATMRVDALERRLARLERRTLRRLRRLTRL